MKEPWKKTCNGKVIITLNDEKTEPTEVELPVDLNWSSRTPGQCNVSVSKTIVLLSFIFLLGLSTYALWKVQELESVIEDDRDIMSILKQTLTNEKTNDPILMILEEKDDNDGNFQKFLKPEPLIGSINLSKQEKEDLRSSESQYQNHKLNSLNSAEPKEKTVDLPVKNSKKEEPQVQNLKNQQTRNTKSSEEIDDARDSPNPNDSEEWIKPLVETFDIFGNHPVEDQFIHNVLMKLLMPENNVEVVEFNKMHGSPTQDENKNFIKKTKPKPFPLPIENLLMKTLLPPASSFKIFHFNEKPENSAEDAMTKMNEQMKIKQIMPAMPPASAMDMGFKIFPINDQKYDSSMEEDMPKITIQSIKLKLLPLPPQEEYIKKDPSAGNIEVIRLNEPQSSEEEPPKMSMSKDAFNHLPLPDFIMKTLLPIKNFDIIPLNERSDQNSGENDMTKQIQQMERMNPPLPFPLQDIIMKTFLPPPNTFDIPMHMLQDTQEPVNQDVEVSKVPVHTVKITSMPIPERIPPPEMKNSMLPGRNFEVFNMPTISEHQELPRELPVENNPKAVQGRSTKLSPVNVPWDLVPPNPHERVEN